MADITLSNGQEVTFDLSKLTIAEYRSLFSRKQTPEDEDLILARVSGMTLDEYQNLPYPDWRRLVLRFFERSRDPIADPNSESESTST